MDVDNMDGTVVVDEGPKTVFVNDGSKWYSRSPKNMVSTTKLPPNLYTVVTNPLTGEIYLEEGERFDMPRKLYGTVEKDATRILDTYRSRGRGTGVLLSGTKGSGKSLTAKMVCELAMNEGIPCVAVNRPFKGEGFFGFVMSLGKCIMYFDEFEKVYREKEDQESILTLLDGVYNSDKMYLLTTNESYGLVDPLQNRPGRIFYQLTYEGVGTDFIQEYCEDNLEDKEQIKKVVMLGSVFQRFNFDMLQAVVEEMNRYGENVSEALRWLNIKPNQYDFRHNYTVKVESLTPGDTRIKNRDRSNILKSHKLPTDGFYAFYEDENLKDKDDEWDNCEVYCCLENMVSTDMKEGTFVYETESLRITATRNERNHLSKVDPYYGMLD